MKCSSVKMGLGIALVLSPVALDSIEWSKCWFLGCNSWIESCVWISGYVRDLDVSDYFKCVGE